MLDKNLQDEIIQKNREFTRGTHFGDPLERDFESDQDLKLPQPPLVKAPMAPAENRLSLCRDFDQLPIRSDLVGLLRDRRSARVYTQEDMTLDQLSFLLWATQGVKRLRGKSYATLRTVPSGGARHPFETYLLVRKITGLRPGAYHYLPMEHALEFLYPVENMENAITDALDDQSWAAKANVVFFWSMVAYRAEWRYGVFAHRVALIDAGHMCEHLYLGSAALGLGTCAVGAFSHELTCQLFGLDGEDEYVVYTAPVGTVQDKDLAEEQAFYQFVLDEGL